MALRATVALECIGDHLAFLEARTWILVRALGLNAAWFDSGQARPWVARITGRDARFGLRREFVRGVKDYSRANSVGSRGVYRYFFLASGVYEVNELQSWSRSRRYFLRVGADGGKTEITREEVDAWLNADSASAS